MEELIPYVILTVSFLVLCLSYTNLFRNMVIKRKNRVIVNLNRKFSEVYLENEDLKRKCSSLSRTLDTLTTEHYSGMITLNKAS
jgi:cell division protein FtsL